MQALQVKFQDYLQNDNETILQDLTAPVSRLNIYKDAYFSRLTQALNCDYPVTAEFLGEDLFQFLARQYIVLHPSTSRSIRWFGDNFPEFLGKNSHHFAEFLAELAGFELALVNALDSQDATAITENALHQIKATQWAKARFELHPSLQWIQLQWNCVAIWKATHKKQKQPVKKYQKPQTWIIWRHQCQRYFVKLTAAETWTLKAMQRQTPFDEICQGLSPWLPKKYQILSATHFLKKGVERGWITKILVR